MGNNPSLQTEVYCDAINCVYEKDKDVMLIVLKLLMLIQNKVRINNLENQKPLIVKHLNQETN